MIWKLRGQLFNNIRSAFHDYLVNGDIHERLDILDCGPGPKVSKVFVIDVHLR